jgi:hypothetical protein
MATLTTYSSKSVGTQSSERVISRSKVHSGDDAEVARVRCVSLMLAVEIELAGGSEILMSVFP